MYYGEKLNSISHLVGSVFSLVALGVLLTLGIQSGAPRTLLAFSVFGLALVLLYAMSTLYHSFQAPRVKKIFKVLDHISIYLLIAGTYTPFMLVSVHNSSGTRILALVWILAAVGSLSEVLLSGRLVKICQLLIYLGMGWACSLDFASLRAALPEAGFLWLAAGGVIYTVGVIFYVLDKARRLNHAHGIWHFFVMVGSVCHFVAVVGYVR
ncbi:MAG: hemolysin III family protein [Halioglobus sp.]